MNVKDIEHGGKYWLTFIDGSRILVQAREDKHRDVDLVNEELEFGRWIGKVGQIGHPSLHKQWAGIVTVEPALVKRANDDPEFNAGLDRLAAMILESERDCE